MFSAAKAPYRAKFRVQTVGIDEVERCGHSDFELMSDFSQQYSQMAIFKVGDDVRQVKTNENFKMNMKINFLFLFKDILALQLMRLFQNVFEQQGLELYLYTYRVIATNPGVNLKIE